MGKISKGDEALKKVHRVEKLFFEMDTLILKVDGKKHVFPLKAISRKLLLASRAEREKFEISSSGSGIHWSLLDEDLSIDGLLGVEHKLPDFGRKKMAV
jgi:hypothetical protein